MNYGIQNEINGITILVSNVLPTYYSDATNVEKACGVMSGWGLAHLGELENVKKKALVLRMLAGCR